MHAIEAQGLTKHYSRGKIKALIDLNLVIPEGTIFGLLGPNGAGKTTFVKLLLSIVGPTRGIANIHGVPITAKKAREKVGYLAENHHFPDFLNADQVLRIYGKMTGMEKRDLDRRIPRLLDIVKLSDWQFTKVRKYSKGMMQRLGIAQAMIHDPEILILDEPTDGIDPVGRREIRDLLLDLKKQGKTILINSHLLSEVEKVSDEIAILLKGELAEKGLVEDFISSNERFQLRTAENGTATNSVLDGMKLDFTMTDGIYNIAVNSDEHLNEIIDTLRAANVRIRSLSPRRISLEDFFIDVVEGKGTGKL